MGLKDDKVREDGLPKLHRIRTPLANTPSPLCPYQILVLKGPSPHLPSFPVTRF